MTDNILRILRNSILSFTADAVARASNTVLFILISRELGEVAGGAFALALTYAMLFTQLSYWGMDQLLTREVAKDYTVASKFSGNFMLIRGIVSVILYLVMLLLVKGAIRYAPQTETVILIVGLSIIAESIGNVCHALFFAFERMEYATLVGLILGALRLVGGTLTLLLGGTLEAVATLLFISSLIGLVLNLGLVYWRFPRPSWRVDVQFWLPQLKTALPFVLIGVFYIIEFQSDTLLLSIFKSEQDVGIYNAAKTVLFALALVPQAFRVAVLPVMSRLFAASSPQLAVVFQKSFKYLLVVSLPTAAAIALSADTVIHLLFHNRFESSVMVLRVVIWTFVLLMINVPSARMMVVANRQDMLALFQGLSMLLNLGLNLILIPELGAMGAAWARLGSTCLFVSLGAVFTWWKLYRWNPFQVITRPLIALVVMIALAWLLREMNGVVAVWGGLLAYALLVWRTGVISDDERVAFVQLLRQRFA